MSSMFSLRVLLLLSVIFAMHSVCHGKASMFRGGEMKKRAKRAPCRVDYCSLPQVCFNGATCTMNSECNAAHCKCTEGYSGPRCRIVATTASITTQSAKTATIHVNTSSVNPTSTVNLVNGCPEGLGCVKGYCEGTSRKCLNCPGDLICLNGYCSFEGNANYQCVCYDGYTGMLCQEGNQTTQLNINPTSTVELVNGCPEGLGCVKGYCEGTSRQCPNCPEEFPCWNGYCSLGRNGGHQCVCYAGYYGVMCQDECLLDCGLNGTCRSIVNGTGIATVCDCDPEFLPGNCTILRPVTTTPQPVRDLHTPDWIYIVVGSPLAMLVALILVVLILGYYMWKKRYMFVLKIIHFFKGYEDDDGKLFDAFISFKSTQEDERFVVHTLYPKLEKELNFKLCLQFRDFLPGETIANNILWAVDNSRRTILLLSPSYVESEFCRMEYQAAQHDMLKLKHKIIPVMYKDISHMKSDMDPTLKSVLNSVTYLEWPEEEAGKKKLDHFWNKLSLSLPKKKVHESPSLDTQLSTTASTVGLTSSFTDNVNMEKETKKSDNYKLNIISMADIDLENKSSSKQYNMTTKNSKNTVNLLSYKQSLM